MLGAPELIVEVLSPGSTNERRDSPGETLREREAKRKQYSVYGVQEYWICDRLLRQVEVDRRQDAVLTLVATLMGQDEITSPLLPNFRCTIARFFS
ncbi:Uma2 family endonuclease [Trichothermofontia sichuanensis]|uniref:Uma2 family endonuclease n=1 Tax=Trichothermofontia sichuanensis TaxID=3045816 RepID=UPI0036F407E0